MAFRTGCESDVLMHLLEGAYNEFLRWTPPHIFLGLWIGNPGDGEGGHDPGDPGNHEVDGAGYARVEVSTQSGWETIGAFEGGETFVNSSMIVFDEATEDWGDLTHFVLCNSLTGLGIQVLVYGVLVDAPVLVMAGSVPSFAAAKLAITVD